jgi:hypothetical protein
LRRFRTVFSEYFMRFRLSGLLFVLILALEVILYAPNFGNFYCGDSLFWFRTSIKSWNQLVTIFSSIDGLGQYRPLTFVFYTYVVHPIAGMSLFRQHVYPLVFHGLDTLLVYWLSLRIVSDYRKALLSAFFFGVSATGAYITYDNACLPDYLYATLYLTALLLLSLKLDSGKTAFGVIGFLSFLGALLSKEAAVTFPAAALIYLLLNRKEQAQKLSRFELRRIAIVLSPSATACLVYLAWHLWKKHGALYMSNPADPHSLHTSLSTLQAKLPFVLQALGVPRISITGWGERFGYGLLFLFVLAILLYTVLGCLRRNGICVSGLVWAVVTVAPAMLILEDSWEQNMYLPLVGISWIFAQAISDLAGGSRFPGGRFRFALVAIPILILHTWGVAGNAFAARTSSWMAAGSKIALDCLNDLRRMYPYIPHNTLLYIESNLQKNVVWYFDSGSFASTFYGDPTIEMRFSEDGLPPPDPAQVRARKVIVLKYLDGRLYDTSARRRLESMDTVSYRIRKHWERGSVLISGKEFVSANQPDRLVFPHEFGLNGSGRDTLVLTAGSTYIHPLPDIAQGSHLRIGATTSLPQATGVKAEIRLIDPTGNENILYTQDFLPGDPDRRWNDRELELPGVAGRGYRLKLSAIPIAGTGNAGNWLEWGPLEIVPPESQGLERLAALPPAQPEGLLFNPSNAKRGEEVVIKAAGGANMEIDCQYSLNSPEVHIMNNCFVMNGDGVMRVKVDTIGHYVFSAIRNSRRQDWVSIRSEWDCR